MKFLRLLPLATWLLLLPACSEEDAPAEPSTSETAAETDELGSGGAMSTEPTESATGGDTSTTSGMRDLTSLEIAAEMAPGVNLWNTLDAYGSSWTSGLNTEIAWGQSFTTKEMVTAIKARGFNTLRIPVTWFQHLGEAPDYTVDDEWMDRVEEVANYALDNGMYAIINIHHDDYHAPPTDPAEAYNHEGSWLLPTYAAQTEGTAQLEKLWTQIATRFKDYDEHLLFETMNEPREVGTAHEWTGGTAENREVVNAFNLAAVDAIRATGGNNAERFVMIPQVGASEVGLDDLVIPHDDPNIIVSVHNYNPFNFTLNESGTDAWGTDAEVTALQDNIKGYHDKFVAEGRAVIIGEWGAGDKDNYDTRVKYYETFANACATNDITSIAWIYSFNRTTLEWEQPLLEDAILSAYQ